MAISSRSRGGMCPLGRPHRNFEAFIFNDVVGKDCRGKEGRSVVETWTSRVREMRVLESKDSQGKKKPIDEQAPEIDGFHVCVTPVKSTSRKDQPTLGSDDDGDCHRERVLEHDEHQSKKKKNRNNRRKKKKNVQETGMQSEVREEGVGKRSGQTNGGQHERRIPETPKLLCKEPEFDVERGSEGSSVGEEGGKHGGGDGPMKKKKRKIRKKKNNSKGPAKHCFDGQEKGIEDEKDDNTKECSEEEGKQQEAVKHGDNQRAEEDAEETVMTADECLCLPRHVSEAGKLCGLSAGVVAIGENVPRIGALSGPFVLDALSKEGSKKKEDKWLLKPRNSWSIEGQAGKTSFGAWGIFDGHGGRQVATFASNSLLKYLSEACSKPLPDGIEVLRDLPDTLQHSPEDAQEWLLQTELVRRLPGCMHQAFLECDSSACKHFKQGGTTATVAISCGWQLVVANVGDSCAYLDTGSEVLPVSANHRLEENGNEVRRIEANGGEVASSTVDGKPAGPIRVWPGGLAMSRTIGDHDSGCLTAAEAEVYQVTIPKDGARLLMGSDGLWDAVHPKTAAHHTRDMTAGEAAHKLLAMAIKKDNLKDDVTVLVVDFCPSLDDKKPPGLNLHRVTGKKNPHIEKLATVWHPLVGNTHQWMEEELNRRVEIVNDILRREEEMKELMRIQEEVALEKKIEKEKSHAQNMKERMGLYDELANLKLSPEDFVDDGWETVANQPHHSKADKADTSNKKRHPNKNRKSIQKPKGTQDATHKKKDTKKGRNGLKVQHVQDGNPEKGHASSSGNTVGMDQTKIPENRKPPNKPFSARRKFQRRKSAPKNQNGGQETVQGSNGSVQ